MLTLAALIRNGVLPLLAAGLASLGAGAAVPENLVVEGVPPLPPELQSDVSRYLEFRGATFQSWHPQRRELLIGTRFADANQLHLVKFPGGARRQLTFLPEPVGGGSFQPRDGRFIVFGQDTGGGEFYQIYRYDLADARISLLTDGRSRNLGGRWSRSGQWIAYTSTRRTGRDTDVYVMNPADRATDRLVCELQGGGWSVQDWSWDDAQLLLLEYVSINESYLHLLDVRSGQRRALTTREKPLLASGAAPGTPSAKISIGSARFAKGDRRLFATTDELGEFQQLIRVDLETRALRRFTQDIQWDIDEFELSHDGTKLAVVANENGAHALRILDANSGKRLLEPRLPFGVMGGLEWHRNGRDLGFSLSSARSPADVYSLDVKSGQLERWTESETGGLDAEKFVEPELVTLKSFDGLQISALVYRPDPKKFSGPRPVLVNIHGGPEGQARPLFLARNNYFLNELGLAMVYPNVRGSSGYGKTFLTLDNGFKREESVRDLGAILNWIRSDARLEASRIAVLGGSYGGYMVLASLMHFSDQLRCGVDVVGISNFLTFLKNTQDYRRDLRRAEYGDERDPKMAEFLQRISPTANIGKIRKPLLVVQGKNDPRVPLSESEQMVKALRDGGGTVWYVMAQDEGHGFQKKRNADFQFLATILFLKEHLLGQVDPRQPSAARSGL